MKVIIPQENECKTFCIKGQNKVKTTQVICDFLLNFKAIHSLLKGYSHNRTEGGVLINNDISLSSIPYLVSHKNM